MGQCKALLNSNDTDISELESHLCQYGYTGGFQSTRNFLPPPAQPAPVKKQPSSYVPVAASARAALSTAPLHLAQKVDVVSSAPAVEGVSDCLNPDPTALLSVDNTLPERDAAAKLRVVASKTILESPEGARSCTSTQALAFCGPHNAVSSHCHHPRMLFQLSFVTDPHGRASDRNHL